MQDKRAYPYPEIVTGDKWHVLETTEHDPQPRTDNLNRQILWIGIVNTVVSIIVV